MKKICNKCNIEKDSSLFDKEEGKYIRNTCKKCRNIQRKKYYNENKEAKLKRKQSIALTKANTRKQLYAHVNKRRLERKLWAIDYLGGCCLDCGLISINSCIYDFHHMEGKDRGIATLLLCSIETIKKELDKCVLLCSNCHRIRHNERNNYVGKTSTNS